MIGKVVFALNPFRNMDELYSSEKIQKYRKNVADNLPPHIYLIGKNFIFFI